MLYLYIVVNLTEGYHRYVGVKLVNELFKVNPHHRRGQYNGTLTKSFILLISAVADATMLWMAVVLRQIGACIHLLHGRHNHVLNPVVQADDLHLPRL